MHACYKLCVSYMCSSGVVTTRTEYYVTEDRKNRVFFEAKSHADFYVTVVSLLTKTRLTEDLHYPRITVEKLYIVTCKTN
jgi:hypothetical protein